MVETTLLIAKDVIYSRLPCTHVRIYGCQAVKIIVFGQIMNVNTNVSDDMDEDIVNACMPSTYILRHSNRTAFSEMTSKQFSEIF